MTLNEATPGMSFRVLRVKVGGEIGRRLADMGFAEGASGQIVRGALMRGPLQVRLGGYDLLIRRGEAACVEIELDGLAKEQEPLASGEKAMTSHWPAGRGFGRGFGRGSGLWRGRWPIRGQGKLR
ncbi:MAG TPA: FeoA family protein [Rectinemataceae bacterium]